jgi:D-glycero-alpha-D-manno-heptose 1-phosphate guanylyltransferase
VDALILCGGLGMRLKPAVPDRPKGLATVSGRPFLDLLTGELVREGFRRLILCVGYGSNQIIEHFRGRSEAQFVFSVEPRPLGTGGAVRLALPHVSSAPFVVVNGDSFCAVRYAELLATHQRKAALATVVVTPSSERVDVGALELAADQRVLKFTEKPAEIDAGRQLVNAGIYVIESRLVESAPLNVPCSLERDILARAVDKRSCYGFPVAGPLVDIGTPERYRAAQGLLR